MFTMVRMDVFLTGATGYIGGSVAEGLVRTGHRVVGLARSEEGSAALLERGIEPLLGTLADHDLLVEASQAADAVVNAADADDPYVATTILAALEGTGKTFVQTSGTSIVGDKAAGEPSDRVYTEDTGLLQPLTEKVGRVAIDKAVLAAAHRGVRSIVLCNSLIYGRGLGVKEDSIQVPWLIDLAKKRGVACHVGRGLNVWSNVHIDDLVELYVLAIDHAPAGAFFFVENGEASMKTVAEGINRLLGYDRDTKSLSIDEAVKEWGAAPAHFTFGSNSRVTADKARRMLGWDPSGPSLEEELRDGSYYTKHASRGSKPAT